MYVLSKNENFKEFPISLSLCSFCFNFIDTGSGLLCLAFGVDNLDSF